MIVSIGARTEHKKRGSLSDRKRTRVIIHATTTHMVASEAPIR